MPEAEAGNAEGGAAPSAPFSAFSGCGRGVASEVLGDWGIGESPDSRTPPWRGIMGVMSGDERGASVIDGETAGSMFGERMMDALRGPGSADDALRADTSEDERLRTLGLGVVLMSMCVGAVPRCRRCWAESWVPCASRARRAASRCSSRMNP